MWHLLQEWHGGKDNQSVAAILAVYVQSIQLLLNSPGWYSLFTYIPWQLAVAVLTSRFLAGKKMFNIHIDFKWWFIFNSTSVSKLHMTARSIKYIVLAMCKLQPRILENMFVIFYWVQNEWCNLISRKSGQLYELP